MKGGKTDGGEGCIETFTIDFDELVAKGLGIAGRGLPQKAGEVVIDGTFTSALKIDEIGVACSIEHDVASLEIAVEEKG